MLSFYGFMYWLKSYFFLYYILGTERWWKTCNVWSGSSSLMTYDCLSLSLLKCLWNIYLFLLISGDFFWASLFISILLSIAWYLQVHIYISISILSVWVLLFHQLIHVCLVFTLLILLLDGSYRLATKHLYIKTQMVVQAMVVLGVLEIHLRTYSIWRM